jgi:epoxyqueuosine reductase
MGNALRVADDPAVRSALAHHLQHPSATVREHVVWALAQAASNRVEA